MVKGLRSDQGRSIAGGLFYVLTAGVSSLLNIAILVAIAQSAGLKSVGEYSVTVVIGTFLYIPASLGAGQLLMREIARRDSGSRQGLLALVAFAIAFLIVVTIPVIALSPSVAFGLLVLSGTANILVGIASSAYLSLPKTVIAGLVVLAYRVGTLCVTAVLFFGGSFTLFALLSLAVTVLVGAPFLVHLAGSLPSGGPNHAVSVRALSRRVASYGRNGYPLALNSLAWFGVLRGDVVIIGLLATPEVLGIYGAAATPIVGIANILGTVPILILPVLSRMSPPAVIHSMRRRGFPVLASVSVLSAVLVITAPTTIGILYGHSRDFYPSITILRILAVSLPVGLASSCLQYALVAVDRERSVFIAKLSGMVWMAAAMPVLFYWHGTTFAAFGSATGDVPTTIVAWIALSRQARAWVLPAESAGERTTSI